MSKVLGGGINGTDDVTGKNINTNNGDIFGTEYCVEQRVRLSPVVQIQVPRQLSSVLMKLI